MTRAKIELAKGLNHWEMARLIVRQSRGFSAGELGPISPARKLEIAYCGKSPGSHPCHAVLRGLVQPDEPSIPPIQTNQAEFTGAPTVSLLGPRLVSLPEAGEMQSWLDLLMQMWGQSHMHAAVRPNIANGSRLDRSGTLVLQLPFRFADPI